MQAHGVNPSHFGLEQHRNQNVNRVFWNLGTAALVENAIQRRSGRPHRAVHRLIAQQQTRGPRAVHRGPHMVGQHQSAFDPARFDALCGRLLAYLWGSDLCV